MSSKKKDFCWTIKETWFHTLVKWGPLLWAQRVLTSAQNFLPHFLSLVPLHFLPSSRSHKFLEALVQDEHWQKLHPNQLCIKASNVDTAILQHNLLEWLVLETTYACHPSFSVQSPIFSCLIFSLLVTNKVEAPWLCYWGLQSLSRFDSGWWWEKLSLSFETSLCWECLPT